MKHSKYYYEKNRNMPVKNELKYFKKDLSEFDSPDLKGSGLKNMSMNFVERLDQARHLTNGVPFRITSGFRTPEYHANLKKRGYHTSPTSLHLEGLAADIATPDARSRYKIITSLLAIGFTRLGIGQGFVHVDQAPETKKSQEVMWDYY